MKTKLQQLYDLEGKIRIAKLGEDPQMQKELEFLRKKVVEQIKTIEASS